MPIYEYRCKKCGEVISELRKASEREDPLECPHCHGNAEVILSTFATSTGDGGAGGYAPANTCGPT